VRTQADYLHDVMPTTIKRRLRHSIFMTCHCYRHGISLVLPLGAGRTDSAANDEALSVCSTSAPSNSGVSTPCSSGF